MNSTGKSPGFTLRKNGGVVISTGRRRAATVSAVCTSSAAPSMLRLRSNWTVIVVMPSAEVEVSALMPAMVESWRSIGEATEAAIVSGLAPGSVAVMEMVGKSTAGSAETGQQPVREGPEDDQRRRDQRRHHGAADTGFGNAHSIVSPFVSYRLSCAARIATRAPFVSCRCPFTTTASPSSTPLSSTVTSPSVRATLTGCNSATSFLMT